MCADYCASRSSEIACNNAQASPGGVDPVQNVCGNWQNPVPPTNGSCDCPLGGGAPTPPVYCHDQAPWTCCTPSVNCNQDSQCGGGTGTSSLDEGACGGQSGGSASCRTKHPNGWYSCYDTNGNDIACVLFCESQENATSCTDAQAAVYSGGPQNNVCEWAAPTSNQCLCY